MSFRPSSIDLRRRSAVLSAVGLPAAAVLGALSGCQGDRAGERKLSLASLTAAEDELTRLASAGPLRSTAAWSWAQTLEHCAQSIEYSMTGFPLPNSRLFQSTVGPAALEVFAWRGRMTHDRTEPIPGAPALAAGSDAGLALGRLRASIAAFRAWRQPLQPHFAYGSIGKPAYELAHAMHLADHLAQFQAAA